MEAIIAQRYAFCDFSNIPGFPNFVPDREVWEHFLLRFRGNKYDRPAENLLDFHECMHSLGIFHEDVLIKMFRYSLEGKAHEWCNSLPVASIASLSDFHAAFNSYCKGMYSTDFLYDECCEEFEQMYSCHSNKDKDVSCEEIVKQNEDFLEHVDSSFEATERNLQPSYFYDHLVVFNSVKEFSVQENDQQFQGDLLAPAYYEAYDLNELFQGEHEEYNLINNADLIQQQLCLLNQLEAFHEFQDPIASWMDSYFSKISNVVSFSMIIICSRKYKMPANFLSHMLYPLWIILNSDMHRVMVLSQMVSWFHWKSDYT
jgi:hypothetical protein